MDTTKKRNIIDLEDFSNYRTNDQIIERARQNLKQGPWDYLVGASESETTQRRNRLSFDKIAFRPRVLIDVTNIDNSITFIDETLRIPVLLAPIGSLQVFDSEGGVAVAKAAGKFGIMPVVSSVTEPSLEETMNSSDFPKIFQLYIQGDWEWTINYAESVDILNVVNNVILFHPNLLDNNKEYWFELHNIKRTLCHRIINGDSTLTY